MYFGILSNNILRINKTRLFIKIIHNVAAIYLQYFFKYYSNMIEYCSNIFFSRTLNIVAMFYEILQSK